MSDPRIINAVVQMRSEVRNVLALTGADCDEASIMSAAHEAMLAAHNAVCWTCGFQSLPGTCVPRRDIAEAFSNG